MNSFTRFVESNGGKFYSFTLPQNLLKNKFSVSNSSCAWYNGGLVINTRLIEYIKVFQDSELFYLGDNNYAQSYFYTKDGYDSRNVISKYKDGKIYDTAETIYPKESYWDIHYRGLEDGRLVVWDNKLYIYGTRWDRMSHKGCICIYELTDSGQPVNEIIIPPQNNGDCEKNWAAVSDRPFTFVYMHNPTQIISVDGNGFCQLIKEHPKNSNIQRTIKGSTQIVRYDESTYISLVHTNNCYEKDGLWYTDYLTAFVLYNNELDIIKMSDWFVFNSPMCEFTCGIVIHDEEVYITYSQFDCITSLLVTDKKTINEFIDLKTDYNNTYGFNEYYALAKQNEALHQYNTTCSLYSYAATLADDSEENKEKKFECVVKTLCNVVKQINIYRKDFYTEFKDCLLKYITKYPEACEFYYLMSLVSKSYGFHDEANHYKELGDKYKTSMHNYFFNYFNPNYL